METGARQLFQSLKSISGLAEHVLVWPGHGAGSACGKALGALPVSSMGYERITNWALGAQSEDSFVREVLSGQPEPPAYFAQMKRLNKEGPPLLSGFRVPPRRLDGRILPKYIAAGIVVIDVREPEAYMAKHIKGTLHIPQYKNFITWAGSLVPYDTDLLLIAPEESRAAEAAKDLAMIGLDRVVGWYGEDVFAEFEGPEGEMEPMDQIPASWLLGSLDEFVVVDVRSKSEWDAGHVPGAIHMPLPSLAKRAQELPRDRKLILHCEGGVRSTIAVSFLYSIGFRDVVNVVDGYRAYEKAKREEALPR
jgi:hydroxyacylglutathione hydrolase